ncbi:MAG: dienelactone hydrolase [Gammaproteobacteria bacterium 39-13]|nr:dienelactone hydrolase family protein [Gammaproteobacteria bacterium]OJV96674.1 MAG: dienelactone hydrolase [Gammaproteobacteria bacterium 39-13]
MKKIQGMVLAGLLIMANSVLGEVKTHPVEYASKGTIMEGMVAYDDANKDAKPGILIVHDWMGLGPFAEDKAKKLAKEGYVAFAMDVYGKGVRPKDEKEAAALANKYKDNRPLLQDHMRAAYDKLISMKGVDPHKIIVMGYCFGGTAALELARSGAPLAGTVVFHGGLSNPTPENAKNIKGKVLVMQGADDPIVAPAEVKAFKDEMQKGGVDMIFIAYPNAVHAYTNPQAGNDKSKGVAYNEQADKKSWNEFETFLKNLFK